MSRTLYLSQAEVEEVSPGVYRRRRMPHNAPQATWQGEGAGNRADTPPRSSGGARRAKGPNKTEARYRAERIDRRNDVAACCYEGLTFRMVNGHRYTPDWVVVTTAGRVECHEVKGAYRMHSHQRARLAFDQARVEFPWARWVWNGNTIIIDKGR